LQPGDGDATLADLVLLFGGEIEVVAEVLVAEAVPVR